MSTCYTNWLNEMNVKWRQTLLNKVLSYIDRFDNYSLRLNVRGKSCNKWCDVMQYFLRFVDLELYDRWCNTERSGVFPLARAFLMM